jgi:type II secretory pathway component PulJ
MSGRRALRVRLSEQSGLTLAELLVAMIVSAFVLTAFLGVMVNAQKDIIHQQYRTRTNDQARLAMEQIDRELRSGTVVYDPTSNPYLLTFETQANATSGVTGSAAQRCVQYRISSSKLMEKRTWTPGGTPGSSGWTVAEGILNQTQSVPAFAFDSSTAVYGYGTTTGTRVVNIVLVVNAYSSDSATDRITSSIALRNQTTGTPCGSPAPTW